jgi:mannose-6-phosphate isomerase-like protein (cupin superfamily)
MTAIFKDIDLILQTTTRMNEMVWSVMGQIYIPKKMNKDIFWWEAILPTETFLPPHFHSTQDKHLYITDGELDIVVDGKEVHATVGQIYSFPLQSTHSLFNNSGKTVKGVFWVEPTNRLFELFKAIHNVVDFSEVVRVSDAHDVHFQLPD